MRTLLAPTLALVLLLHCSGLGSLSADEHPPQWIWVGEDRTPNEAACLKKQFTLDKPLRRAQCLVAAEYCHARIFLNGKLVAVQEPYAPISQLDITESMRYGENTLGVCCLSVSGPAAVMA